MIAPLVVKMRAYAKDHPGNERMVELADEMERAINTANSEWNEQNMKKMIGATARARRHWCEVTGEPLVPQSTIETGARLFSALLSRRQ